MPRADSLAEAIDGEHRVQAIAANLDTLFVVTSCNDDFNPSRLERYLAVAFDAHVEPVVVLTKADLCHDVTSFVDEARSLANTLAITAVLSRTQCTWITDAPQHLVDIHSTCVGTRRAAAGYISIRGRELE